MYTAIAPSTLQGEMDVADERPEIDPILDPDADAVGERDVDDPQGPPYSSTSTSHEMCDARIADQGMILAITRLTMSDREYEGKVNSMKLGKKHSS